MGTHDVDPTASRPRVCFDRVLPRDLARPHVAFVGTSGKLQAIAPLNKQWPNGSVLSVAFIGGTSAQRDLVKATAPAWSRYANVRLDFRPSLPATIRVAFDPADGAWSYVGTDALEVPATAPTMNLGWDGDPAMITHEFGHALSLAHEHQNPSGGIRWNEAAVIADLSGPPNYWDEATIRHNVLEKYTLDQVLGTAFDQLSIMLYSFPASWTTDGFSAPWNQAISPLDGLFVGSEKMYPQGAEPPPPARKLLLKTGINLELSRGAQAEYEFAAPVAGDYVFETAGALDVVLALYQGATLLRTDDDSGRGSNARIEATLQPGTYRVVVRCYSAQAAGKARLIAWG